MVGAVLVRDGRRVAEGYHHRYGQAHAEVDAIRRAGKKAKGCILYVNLEPCSHWGKTPPCVRAIVRAGIRRVVAAMRDPNPTVFGKGIAYLRRHHIPVTVGVLRRESERLNHEFVERFHRDRPFVTIKIASSLDGRTATVAGESKWITSLQSRQDGYRLRARVDAIAVGANTIRRDNPTLTAHGMGRNPTRIVFAGNKALPKHAHVFNRSAKTWILKDTRSKEKFRRALTDLASRGVRRLLVEGGATLQQSFWEAGAVDEVVWFFAPVVIGNVRHLKEAKHLTHVKVDKMGPDWRVRACLPELSRRLAK
jgi:diaminohydroxyphosphoribosylaminopyrimidine deaminase/5-amino-6-(5-phosphoribosylamino)uracil reductase